MADPARRTAAGQTFLRIPPFPGRRASRLAFAGDDDADGEVADVRGLAVQIAQARVGGSFWGARLTLPPGRDVILAPATSRQAAAMLRRAVIEGYADRCLLLGAYRSGGGVPVLRGTLDPWHLAAQARRVIADGGHEFALVAALADVRLEIEGDGVVEGRFAALASPAARDRCIGQALLAGIEYRDPFTGRVIAAQVAVALLAEWRALIEANRPVKAILGIARWKRVTMDALLWDGSGAPRHAAAASPLTKALRSGDSVIAWKSRTSAALLSALETRGVLVGEIEDGMIRSRGLGANCVPPLSVIVDPNGAHFDPHQVSGLEQMLQQETISAHDCRRAARLREHLVAAGISKYGRAEPGGPRPPGARRRVLVTGQVEDDRSVRLGGAGLSNLALLQRVRALEPEAHIIYKPHPDVEAGHRIGRVRPNDALGLADEIDSAAPITALIDTVDVLHVITSLAGFEALMRGTAVTTHGVPFYAGWGLTDDRGPVPARRTRRRTLDELVAATLILYPRYLDPVTRLPCPAEVVVDRLATDREQVRSPLVALRALQGKVMLRLQR